MPSQNVQAFAGGLPATGPPSRNPAEAGRPAHETHDAELSAPKDLHGLEFNARLLEEAQGPELPVQDRLRLVSLSASKLDEFFAFRVAGLKQRQVERRGAAADGPLPAEELERIAARARELLELQHATWRDRILPALEGAGPRLIAPAELSPEQREAARRCFGGSVFAALTPLAVDPGHPFPHLRDRSLSLAVSLLRPEGRRRRRGAASLLAVVQVPPVLPRLVPLPHRHGEAYALLEDIIAAMAGDLFPGHSVRETAVFRVTRRLDADEHRARSPTSAAPLERRRRDRGAPVRLEISADASRELEAALAAALRLEPRDVYRMPLPLQIADLLALYGRRDHDR